MKYLFYTGLTCLFLSCQIKLQEIPEPDNLIPEDTMVLVLEDLMLIESHVQTKYPQVQQFQECAKNSGDSILKFHHLSFARLSSSLDYYGSRQEKMKEIYNKVLENMNKKLNEIQAK